MQTTNQRRNLERDGFCVIEGVLDARMLAELSDAAERMLAARSSEHFEDQVSTGSMISVCDDPFMARLISYPAAIQSLRELGFENPKWWSGYVISKPPHSPPLFWHQDWWAWDDPDSYTEPVIQLFLMYYLVDTDRDNGCLRVVPGSHLKRHPLHDEIDRAHGESMRRMKDPDHAAFQAAEGEVDVPVRAGDLVIGDARLLHAAHANPSDSHRTVVTLWYFPQFESLSEPTRARIVDMTVWPESWTAQGPGSIASLRPTYAGGVEPIELNRDPGAQLA